jgi:signal transduction histidine kinase
LTAISIDVSCAAQQNLLIRRGERCFVFFQAATLCICLGAVVVLGRHDQWPAGLLIALAALGCSGMSGLRTDPEFRVNNASIAVIVAATLVGPAPAVLVATTSMVYDAIVFRATPRNALTNVWAYAFWALVIGLGVEVVVVPGSSPADELALVALVALIVGDLLNFFLIALEVRVTLGKSIVISWLRVWAPVVPWLLVAAALTAGLVLAYEAMGSGAIWCAVVLVVAQNLVLRTIVRGQARDSQLDIARAEALQRAAEIDSLAADRARLVDLMLGAEEAERERLAELLHDSVLQELMIARQVLAEGGGELARAELALGAATGRLRASLLHLHPLIHEQIGLKAALEAVGEFFPRLRQLSVQVDSSATDGRVDNRLLFWLARELLINALKHSRAMTVSVVVESSDSCVRARVEDDGVGMLGSEHLTEHGHLGLALCARRVQDAGGQLTLSVPAPGGTRVEVTLPVRVPEQHADALRRAPDLSNPARA